MAYNSVLTSAPGSIMLFGEHGVLENNLALAMAIDVRINVEVTLRSDDLINIFSELGQYQTRRSNLHIEKPFEFILGALLFYQSHLQQGLDITVSSTCAHHKGFGSSAAVTVAMVAALDYLTFQETNKETIFLNARHIIQTTQGRGSGTDALASTMGKIVAYQIEPFHYQIIPQSLPIQLIYCGYKTKTAKVIQLIQEKKSQSPELIDNLFQQMNKIAYKAIEAINNRDLITLGKLMNAHQICQRDLGTSDDTIDMIIRLCKTMHINGAKISGSGLGDCVAVLGVLPTHTFPNKKLPNTEQIIINTDLKGVLVHHVE